jgi:hypothetical protein
MYLIKEQLQICLTSAVAMLKPVAIYLSMCVDPRVLKDLIIRLGLLAVVWFGSSPTPSPLCPLLSASFLSLSFFFCRRSSLPKGEGGEGVGEKPNHSTARKRGPLYIIEYSLTLMVADQASQVREALELINTAQQAATTESREGAKKLAFQQQVTIIPLHTHTQTAMFNWILAFLGCYVRPN